ncbi:hypothetical protein SAMD00019534_092150, partial [Acytostelium subglobosum LB1]|uniref:hypothetical protein n=1 Tax=Acytostelium subglobosum LB1 TaxID=1410327 RepID=UPI0006450546
MYQRRHLLQPVQRLLFSEVLVLSQHLSLTSIIPKTIKKLIFDNEFNAPIDHNVVIPAWITELVFGQSFNKPISEQTIPSSVTSLIFGDTFNQTIMTNSIPSSITSLRFGNAFNQLLTLGAIPASVTSLTFGERFNQVLNDGVIPSTISTLSFGSDFNRELGSLSLPASLTSLSFGNRFNQVLTTGSIPSTVTMLRLGHFFNQSLAVGQLPTSLTELSFGKKFKQPLIAGVFPSSIRTLSFGRNFNQPLLEGVIPPSVKTLVLGYKFNQSVNAPSVTSLSIGDQYYTSDVRFKLSHLHTSTLQHLTSLLLANDDPEVFKLFEGGRPLNHVTSLTLTGYGHRLSPGMIPSSVVTLNLPEYCDDLQVNDIPSSVINLTLGNGYNQSDLEPGVIPSSVVRLNLGDEFKEHLCDGSIPMSVTKLSLNGQASFENIEALTNLRSITLHIPNDYSGITEQIFYQTVPTNTIRNCTQDDGQILQSVRVINYDQDSYDIVYMVYNHIGQTYSFGAFNIIPSRVQVGRTSARRYKDKVSCPYIPFQALSRGHLHIIESNRIIHCSSLGCKKRLPILNNKIM